METMAARIRELNIGMTARSSSKPIPEDWGDPAATQWQCTLTYDGRVMRTPFTMGSGLGQREPRAEEVLDSLASDAAGYDNARSFEEWAEEYGYDTDSRKAERVYRAVEKSRTELAAFLGDAYDAVVFDTESL